MRGANTRVVAPALLVLALLAIWQLYARSGAVDAFILPAPTDVARALWHDRGLLWDNLLVTAQEVGLGVLVDRALEPLAPAHLLGIRRPDHVALAQQRPTCGLARLRRDGGAARRGLRDLREERRCDQDEERGSEPSVMHCSSLRK